MHIYIGVDGDEMILPSESSVFGFFGDERLGQDPTAVYSMREQRVYYEDSFGLRSMDERGRLKIVYLDDAMGMGHNDFLSVGAAELVQMLTEAEVEVVALDRSEATSGYQYVDDRSPLPEPTPSRTTISTKASEKDRSCRSCLPIWF